MFKAFFLLASSLCALDSGNLPRFSPLAERTLSFQMNHTLEATWLKHPFLSELKTLFQIDTFVETGTYLGSTAFEASQVFPAVHSIELYPPLYENALKHLAGIEHIHLHQGESGDILDKLIPTLSGRVLYYLDAHFSGGGSALGRQSFPVLEELAALRKNHSSDAVILIDDIRIFQDVLFPELLSLISPTEPPSLKEIIEAVLEVNPRYIFCFLGDSLLAFPPDPKITPSKVVCACALHRLAWICPWISEEELDEADRLIAQAQGSEREQLLSYHCNYSPVDFRFGYRSFAALWAALLLDQEGSTQAATELFRKSAQTSPSAWRIDAYRTR